MDVSRWLRELGLEDYVEAFQANHIDAEVLPRLTADDLAALGITSIGHRRRLLDAIAALNRPGPAAATEPVLATRPSGRAERRQLTVLFCDLVGSTELAARLDPEDLRGVMAAYQRCAAAVVERFEGHIAKYLGDGVLAYFGWPQAHEDDAERAARAGLALVEAVAGLEPEAGVRLQARIGIATGQVVVGDLVGAGASRDEAVVGETPNLAARLQALAGPGTVVIGEATRRLLGGLFQLDDLGPRRLKGFAAPLAAWQVAGESPAEGRFEARHSTGLTPLVGREEEIALLLRRWAQAREGEGHVVLLSGEPGIGKSRIVRELRARLADEPHLRLLYQCSPHHTTSPLHPQIEQLERAAGFARDDPPQARSDKLVALLARGTNRLDAAVPLIAALLGLPTDDRYPMPELTPQRQKELTLEVLLGQLEGLAAAQPVLLAYEDVHWIDPTTQELLGLVIERLHRQPVLALITFRSDFTPPWSAQPHVSTLALTRLGRHEGAALVERVSGAKALPGEVAAQIVAKTDGVPLFVEELTKTVLESGLLQDAGDRWELAGPLPPLAIPSTLHDSLLARLDRLAPVKEIAQIGAAIGREFSHALLATVADRPEPELKAALDQLVQSELIFRRGTPPERTYSFKHALVQEAAYGTLLKSRRQQLHARIADVLETHFPEVSASEPEVLARHLTEAGLAARAIPYWRRAGELASERSANVEAIAHLSNGLELVATLPETAESCEDELALRLAIGGPLIATRGSAAPEVERTYSRASALCDRLGRSAELFPILRGLWHCYLVRGELERAYELAERLVVLADDESPLCRALARRARGTTLFFLGRFADAATALHEGIAIEDESAGWDEPAHFLLYTERAGIVCRLYIAWALWFLGFPDRAVATIEGAIALGQRLEHVPTVVFALTWAALLHYFRREFDTVQSRADAAIDLAREHGLSERLADATMCRGCALVGLGQHEEGIAELRTGLAALNVSGARLPDTQWLGSIAEAQLRAGQPAEALHTLDRAAEAAATTGESHYLAELHRLRGRVLAELGEDAEAASWLLQAIDTARGQQAKSLELRAAMSLARLWRDQGKHGQAHDLLAPVYGWFTEGFDTPDLTAAKALLAELAWPSGAANCPPARQEAGVTGTMKEAER